MGFTQVLPDGSAPAEFSWLRPRTWSFTAHLALAMMALAAGLLAGMTLLTISRVQAELSSQVARQLESQAQSLNNLTGYFLLDKVGDLQVLVTSEDLVGAVEASNDAFAGTPEEIEQQLLALDRQWLDPAARGPLVERITAADRDINVAAFQLSRFLRTFNEHAELLLTDRHGATVGATGEISDFYQADEAWWRSAWNDGAGQVFISPPEYDESAGISAMLIAVPIYDGGRTPVGILRSTLDVADVLSVMSTLRIGNTGFASLIDGNGEAIAAPGIVNAMGPLVSRADAASMRSPVGHDVGDEAIVAHARLVRENFTVDAISSVDPAVVDAVMGLGLMTVVRQERDEALAAVATIVSSGRNAMVVAMAASILLALFSARFVTKPLKRLAIAAEALGSGRLDTPLPPAYSGELTHLTETFASMSARLQELIASLETRSKELAESNHALVAEIQERKRAEEELSDYRDQLEVRIDERTRELEAIQVELMRKEKLHTLGQLTEKIALEIRSPLGTVAASLFLLRGALRNVEDERYLKALERADRSIKRCDRIVNELFIYSDRQSPALQDTPLDAWLAAVVDRIEVPAGIQKVSRFGAPGSALIDRALLGQAVESIVLNAVQAMEESTPPGGVLEIATVATPARIEIRISDTGPGILSEIRDQVMEPLFSTRPTGIGLGLPLAKSILEEHWGGLALEDSPDGGTVAVLWLPVPA